MKTVLRRRSSNGHERGQSLVELAISLPVVLLLLLGMLEFGFAFSHHLVLEYATREGARVGAALANGTDEVVCGPALDEYVIAAVQRVLTPGGQIPIPQVNSIYIYKADANGNMGSGNKWVPSVDASGNGTGPVVEGQNLKFARSGGTNWNPCSRTNTSGNTNSIGVSIAYDYLYITPLGNLMGVAGTPDTLRISDRTIMALNPSAP